MSLSRFFKSSILALAVAIVATGCTVTTTSNGPGPSPSGDTPELKVSQNGAAEVGYPQQDGVAVEAWEVVAYGAGETWLNYSRFSFGTMYYQNEETYLCTSMVNGEKYVGVSENQDRLTAAMSVVIAQRSPSALVTYNCAVYQQLVAQDPWMKSLTHVFDMISNTN